MAYKTLIFGVDDMFNDLQPFYAREVQRGNLEIIAYAVLEQNKIRIVPADGKSRGGGVNNLHDFALAIISSQNDFYNRMKFLEAQGIPHNRIIDGRVFMIPNFDFTRLINEGVVYSSLNNGLYTRVSDLTYSIYQKVFSNEFVTMKLGVKSYISNAQIGRIGTISVGNFCALAWNLVFALGFNWDHNHKNIGSYGLTHFDWNYPQEFYQPEGNPEIRIGSDVWIGSDCVFKCSNPNKPLIIGDGAVIASDSVVVKNVPPYAIVGGNPAQIIKFRFSEDVIEALLRIKWWDWSLDKIHDNFKYFNDIDKFISLHDK